MTELAVKYKLDADGLLVKDLIEHRDFLAQRLSLPKHLLHVLSWGYGSVVIRYWVLRDVLPLAEVALYREDSRGELTQQGVEDVCFANHPLQQPTLVRCRGMAFAWLACDIFHCSLSLQCVMYFIALLPPPMYIGGPATTRCTM